MNRHLFKLATLSLVTSAVLGTHPVFAEVQSSAQAQKPNVLFILTDDQTYDAIGAFGNQQIITPNLDRLAKQGMSFTHVYNQGSYTPAICAASRRMISTGRHLYQTGLGPQGTEQAQYPLWGETFRNNGYQTFLTGKWHMPKEVFARSYEMGRAVYNGGMSYEGSGGQWEPKLWNYDADNRTGKNYQVYVKKQHSTEQIADAAVEFIENRDYREPYFAYVGFMAPHDPRQSPQKYIDMYPTDNIEVPANFVARHGLDQGDYYIRDEMLMSFPRSASEVQKFIAEYYAMVTHMDEHLGRILDAVENSGEADNTIIIFTSDHGLAVGKHGLAGKQSQYDHSVRAPFIIAGKGIPQDQVAKGMFYLNSVFPTTAELAGIDVPETVQAPSIVPLLQGESEQLEPRIIGSYRQYQRMITDGQFKLIVYPMTGEQQLFDLTADPHEMNNLAADPQFTGKIALLKQDLQVEMTKIGDPLTFANPKVSYRAWLGGEDCKWQMQGCPKLASSNAQ